MVANESPTHVEYMGRGFVLFGRGAKQGRTGGSKEVNATMRWVQVLHQVVVNLDLPYGYTISIWAAGAIAALHFGPPQMLDIFLFVFGAMCSYLMLALLTYSVRGRSSSPVRGIALMNGLAILPAVAVSLLPNFIASRELGYFLAASLATATYALSTALLLSLAVAFWRE